MTQIDDLNRNRDQVLDQIVSLATHHKLTADEINARLVRHGTASTRNRDRILRTVLAFFGGIFLLAGLSSLIGLIWDDLSSVPRVLISFGAGIVALVLAITAANHARFPQGATPLFILAALLQPTGLFVFLNEYSYMDDTALAGMAVFGAMALQMGLLFWKMPRTALLFFTIVYGFMFLAASFSKLEVSAELVALVLGLSGLLISHAVNQTRHCAFTPATFFIFAFLFAYGVYDLLAGRPPFDLLLIVVASGIIYASVPAQSRSLLVAGVIIMLGFISYFTTEYFSGMLSWPVALVLTGLVMLILSSLAFRRSRKIGVR